MPAPQIISSYQDFLSGSREQMTVNESLDNVSSSGAGWGQLLFSKDFIPEDTVFLWGYGGLGKPEFPSGLTVSYPAQTTRQTHITPEFVTVFFHFVGVLFRLS